MPVQYTLPLRPMSVNEAYRGRRFKSAAYKKYAKDVGLLLAGQRWRKVPGPIEVTVELYLAKPKQRDADNCVKPLLDLLVQGGVIDDDRNVWALHVHKYRSPREGVRVTVASCEGDVRVSLPRATIAV